ncbi:molybdopterin-containing oxidoreductase family protein [Xanthobacter pseudotagetidis]|uniref:molybdopterin-containing oxidoreductase family protein n=1 Tax=Xanthobacter pseudotagetidis TaxID=3119911 RepID=UPI00372A6B2B
MADADFIKTTCPRDCYDACGIVVSRKGGTIQKVLGDPEHAVTRGALCGKCAIAYNGAWRAPELRLSTPLRRVGAKGEGAFAPISWDEALALIAERFGALAAAGAARTILHTHYTGTVGLVGGWYPIRFFNRLGATEVDPDTVCNKAGHVALEMTFGNSLEGFDPRTAREARTIVVWGANPSFSAPHQNKGWLKAAQAAGTRIIAVDPIAHDTARAADLHLQLLPGSDAALAFAFIHVLKREGLADEAFLAAHVLGAEELARAIAAMTPERAAALSGVPAALIEEAARAYGAGPSLLWLGQGVQRQPFGGNAFRALAALVAFSGNLGKPGAGFLYMNGPGGRGIDMATLTCPELAADAPPAISHMDLAATLEDAERARAFVNWNNNPAASSPEQARLRRALKREDLFHVGVELFHTDTTAYADIVLPAASFLECDDLVLSYFDLTVSAQVKAGDPPGAALPNAEIFRRLAAAMGFTEPELFESDAALIARLLAQTPFRGTFADLAVIGTATVFPEPKVQFEGLAFGTSSGRIELASAQAEALGLPRLPLAHADAPPGDGQVRILSPASQWQMNSSYGNDPMIRRRLGPPTVALHPDDAVRQGLAEGDAVLLANDEGRVPVTVTLSDRTLPGVGLMHKGRWPGLSPGDANVNALVPGRKSDIAESTAVHGTEARLVRPEAAQ